MLTVSIKLGGNMKRVLFRIFLLCTILTLFVACGSDGQPEEPAGPVEVEVTTPHPATISRIANGKFIRCEWGFFEIRYFFVNSVASDGDGPSKESVKQEISKILAEHESSGNTKKLSDEKLTAKLAEKGIKIARRTVAKYRAELNIKSSFDRK